MMPFSLLVLLRLHSSDRIDCRRRSNTSTLTSYYFGMSTFRPVMMVKWKPSTAAQPQPRAPSPTTVPKPPFSPPRNVSQGGSLPPGPQQVQGVWATVAAERALACSLLGFGCVAFDVFSPASLHLLAGVDTAAHTWVTAHLPPVLQRTVMGKLVSDTGIVLGLLGWAGAAVYAATSTQSLHISNPIGGGGDHTASSSSGSSSTSSSNSASSSRDGLGIGHALLVAAVGYAAGGAFKHDDPLVVSLLKHLFGRARPSGLGHSTFAFPSGHTTAAVYVVGTLLCLLLPVLLEDEQRRHANQQQERQAWLLANRASATAAETWDAQGAASPAAPASPATETGRGPLVPLLETLLQHRGPLWAGAALVTASGRVLADAHWVSDTLAGACLGTALVSATVLCWRLLGFGQEQRVQ